MDFLTTLAILVALITIWLNILATLAIRHDHTLDSFQKNSQFILVWLIPIFGSSIVLHLIFNHSPEAVPHSWIPWPLRTLIFGRTIKNNKDREEDIDYRTRIENNHHQETNDIGENND